MTVWSVLKESTTKMSSDKQATDLRVVDIDVSELYVRMIIEIFTCRTRSHWFQRRLVAAHVV